MQKETNASQNSNAHIGQGPKGYKRSADRIQDEVCELLARHPQIDASDIEVSVNDEIVTLSGTVPDRQTKHLVEQAIEEVWGVDDIVNRLRIATSAAAPRVDERQPSQGATASPNGGSDRSGAV
jgi:osmotically-inducible protein OsmY